MLRIYFPQQCPGLPSPVDEESLYAIESMRPAGPRLGKDVIPDETGLLNFRHFWYLVVWLGGQINRPLQTVIFIPLGKLKTTYLGGMNIKIIDYA